MLSSHKQTRGPTKYGRRKLHILAHTSTTNLIKYVNIQPMAVGNGRL